ncbi:MAG TPA: hypothetical protein VH083_03225 [Myxococcales bacterium]|nr:hypothetical protein [Myxococcales bacterium]
MKLVALVSAAKDPEEAVKVLTEAAGSTAAEARMRLAPEPPALLARLDDALADELVSKLRKAGLAALAVDARVPSDADRFQTRKFALEKESLKLEARSGETLELPWGEVALILRAQRARRSETDKTETSKKFSIGSAVLTGGLKVTKTSSSVVRSAEEQAEQLLLIYLRDGRSASLAETNLDFTGLGALQPSRTANMLELANRLRSRAKAARYDDRLVRLGRRSLPFGGMKEQRLTTAKSTTLHTDTAGTVDILADLLWQAQKAGLI